MKFACIEYTTKSGAIWRHHPERPNYLCDPHREIDPTSFGCYTSALQGVHIPLTGLIYGTIPYPPGAAQRVRQDLVRIFRGHFPSYALDALAPFDVLLFIYQLTNDEELVRAAQRIRDAFPEMILVSSSSPPFGRLREYWKDHARTADRYRAFIEASQFNMNVCRATVPWYRTFSSVPSLYLPQPYPVEYALDEASRQQDRRPVIYVAGDTVRPDIMTGHLIAKVLQQRHPEYRIRLTKTPEFPLNTAFLRGTRHEIMPFRPWAEQLRELAAARLVINTDLWWTRGRVPVDCAAAGVPCVGTTSDGQSELWPSLTAQDSVHVDQLLDLAERALTDEAFRETAMVTARERLRNYSYAQSVHRFSRAVDLARAGRLNSWRDPIWQGGTLVLP